jgi:hypothetical protein
MTVRVVGLFSMRLVAPLLCALASSLAGCSPVDRWDEEVQLSDGRVIRIEREVQWEKTSPLGGQTSYLVEDTTLTFAPEGRSTRWRGSSEFLLLLDFDTGRNEYVLVTRPSNCRRYRTAGKPRPPYLVYRMRGGKWEVVDFAADLVGKRTNLLVHPQPTKQAAVTTGWKQINQTRLPATDAEIVGTGGIAGC